MSRRAKILIFVVVLALVIGGLIIIKPFGQNNKMQKINLTTEDGLNLVAWYWPATSTKAVLLVHQFGRDKESWGSLTAELNQSGLAVLALDLRGHGESDLNYQSFSEADFNKMILDIKTARDYLVKQGQTKIDIVGSSIGANLAIMSVGEGLVERGVALSPGIDFKGLAPEKAAKLIKGQDKILLISAEDDSYSYESVQMLLQILGLAGKVLNYSAGGHGVALLGNQPDLASQIIEFLNK